MAKLGMLNGCQPSVRGNCCYQDVAAYPVMNEAKQVTNEPAQAGISNLLEKARSFGVWEPRESPEIWGQNGSAKCLARDKLGQDLVGYAGRITSENNLGNQFV